jgi:hypothetical protein
MVPIRADRGTRSFYGVLLFTLLSSLWCYGADVVFVRSAAGSSAEQHQVEIAATFYGLNVKYVTAGDAKEELSRAVQQDATLAVAIEANTLALVNQRVLLPALHRKSGDVVPVLILGITPDTDPSLLKMWSDGAVIACRNLQSPLPLQYKFGLVEGITQQLSGVEIPFAGRKTAYLSLARHSKAQLLLGAAGDGQVAALFVETNLHRQELFLAAKMPSLSHGVSEWSAENVVGAFAEIAPVMIFVKHSAGERGWRAVHHYANLTIDDPWLREPYGFLSYSGLLQEMEIHNFHTTIAFIPWNYDRSQPGVVSLLRSHADRFSICLHGNDHDHKEFTDLQTKPLPLQVAALRQSLVRMEKFQALTGIPYDRVMVFPHSIGSEVILDELRTHNFLATVNSSNVPMDRIRPSSLLFALRPVTLLFADFPSLLRYSTKMQMPNGFLAMNEFLDNPLFFYCHHDSFENGMDAFNATADAVNRLEPDTHWRSLGEIVKHLYLLRKRDDSDYEVLSFSNDIQLENTIGRDLTFYVKKPESAAASPTSVKVDGSQHPFYLRNGYLEFRVSVVSGKARRVRIEYGADSDLASNSDSTLSPRVYFLRMASDFRDIVLSRYTIGRRLVELYYKNETTAMAVLCAFALILSSICVFSCLKAIIRRRNSVSLNSVAPNYHTDN